MSCAWATGSWMTFAAMCSRGAYSSDPGQRFRSIPHTRSGRGRTRFGCGRRRSLVAGVTEGCGACETRLRRRRKNGRAETPQETRTGEARSSGISRFKAGNGWRSVVGVVGGVRVAAAHRRSGDSDAMGLVEEAVEDRLGERGVGHDLVPGVDEQLTGDDGGAKLGAVLDDLQQATALLGRGGAQEEVVKDAPPSTPRAGALLLGDLSAARLPGTAEPRHPPRRRDGWGRTRPADRPCRLRAPPARHACSARAAARSAT
jgi:hypothetical protein